MSIEDLRTLHTKRSASIADLQSQIDGLQTEVDGIQAEIDKLSGWRKGISGLFGFDFANSSEWVSNRNADARATSLSIGLNGFLHNDKEKTFWYNKGIIQKAWQDVDKNAEDRSIENDGLFDNETVDVLNISSLFGYKIREKLAVSALAELNTSIGQFLDPGTLDIGVGVTWLPIQNMTVTLHPINYHYAFSGIDGLESVGALGTKFRLDYFNDFNLSGVGINWTTTITGFVPYSDEESLVTLDDGSEFTSGLREYTWINTISIKLIKGFGIGIGLGLRNSKFESQNTQTYTTFGVTYGF